MVSTRSMRMNVDRTQYRDSAVNESPIIRATTFRSKSYVPEEFSTLRCSVNPPANFRKRYYSTAVCQWALQHDGLDPRFGDAKPVSKVGLVEWDWCWSLGSHLVCRLPLRLGWRDVLE